MTDTQLHPRIEGILSRLGTSLSGRSVIDRGPDAVWDYVCEKLATFDGETLISALADVIRRDLSHYETVTVELQPGDSPGDPRYISINVTLATRSVDVLLGWWDMDEDVLIAEATTYDDTMGSQFVGNVISSTQLVVLSESANVADINCAAEALYEGMRKFQLI